MQNDNIIPIRAGVSNNTYHADDNDDPSNAYIEMFISSLAYKRPEEVIAEILTQIEIIDDHMRSLVVNHKEISRVRANLYKIYIASKALESYLENKGQPVNLDF
ncbi:hypothetical protein CTN06_06340 [Pectobacterium zantedeschiae]|uniref:Uncharacterized protein n=2 Tax=Pectobacterium zantedeschiae TaxID=2034769 RepID=A0A9X8JHJ7_9GAMM|nr:hypothetical protein CLR69_01275 [Pectobacterium zantedeschiae]RYC49068.1 hypothetical protein CTN06_06340 [Pectobacterium zantedeschiae]